MADKYRRVRKDQEKLPDNEIRVKRSARIGRYLRRANDLLTGKIAGSDSVVIKGVSNAMESAVKLAELIKHRVTRVYQVNKIANITIVDEFEPLEEGLDYLTQERQATMLTITLSRTPLDNKDIGY
jgi:DNA-binding protein